LGKKEGENVFLLSSLSNAKEVHIEEDIPSSDDRVVSKNYISSRAGELFPKNRKNLPLNTRVRGSDDHSICNNSSFVEIVRLKAEEMYIELLRRKITGEDESTLGKLASYLDEKTEDIINNYVKNNECSSITLNSVGEGCKFDYDTLSLDNNNSMITKQKFKSVISLAMSCHECQD